MALHAHNANGNHTGTLDYSTQAQSQWQPSFHESDLSSSSESSQTAETGQSIFSGPRDNSHPKRGHSIAIPTSTQQPVYDLDPSSQSVPLTTGGGAMATAPFLKDFNLVAEAAKRAQMAVLMREMEGVNL